MIAIGRMIGEAENFDGHAVHLCLGACARQDRPHVGALAEPSLDRAGLRVIGRVDVDIGGEPAVEPGQEGAAEGLDHGGDADIDSEREQQRHQCER